MHLKRFLACAMSIIMMGGAVLAGPTEAQAAKGAATAGIASVSMKRQEISGSIGLNRRANLAKERDDSEVREILGIDDEDMEWLKKIAKDDSTEKRIKKNTAKREDIVQFALSFVGKIPYVYGGDSLETGVDCSGFVQQVFKHFGVDLPRTSGEQGSTGESISFDEIRPGDLIYYGGHIAIYIGDGQVVHASNRKTGIKVSIWNYRSVRSIRNVLK